MSSRSVVEVTTTTIIIIYSNDIFFFDDSDCMTNKIMSKVFSIRSIYMIRSTMKWRS